MAITLNGTTGIESPSLSVDSPTLFVDSVNNRVAVGTITPSATLSVYNNSDWALIDVRPSASDRASALLLRPFNEVDSTNPEFFIGKRYENSGDGKLHFWRYDGTNHLSSDLTIDNSGFIGIGTTSTVENLEVYGVDAASTVHYAGNSRGGIAALSTQRLVLSSSAIADDILFGYAPSAPITSANFVSRMKIDNGTGDVSIVNGNLIIGTSGKGIDFSANSNSGGMTSELLDDYEEGTWTPTLTFGGGSTGVSYSFLSGNYVKIGNRVIASCTVFLSNKGTSTGDAVISGLPFTVNQISPGNFVASAALYGDRITPFQCFSPNGTSYLRLATVPSGVSVTVTALTHNDLSNTTYIGITISYKTDS